jgi:hypothetical protein
VTVSATTSEVMIAKMYAFASGAKKLPCSPVRVSTGTKTSATMNVA